MNSELFILGDARFLSGGAPRCQNVTYDAAPPVVRPGEELTSSKMISGMLPGSRFSSKTVSTYLSGHGQNIHMGRDAYHAHSWHGNGTIPNIFVSADSMPTAGVELETYVRPQVTVDRMIRDLVSNWFHFEEDGSLDRCVGHELITDVLAPRYYRDLRLWTGLQNLVGPYLESYSKVQTGLHVHVGVSQFDGCDLPVDNPMDKRALAKYAIAFVYHGLLDTDYLDKVFLRKNGEYCAAAADPNIVAFAGKARIAGITAGEMFDTILASKLAHESSVPTRGTYHEVIESIRRNPMVYGGRQTSSGRGVTMDFDDSYYRSHYVELNFGHPYTAEFRRGKGTTNAISIHRMVELCTLIVRYVWKLARNTGDLVNAENAYRFIAENTNSEALRKITEAQLARHVKGGKE